MRLYPITRDMSENYVDFDRSEYPLIKMTFTGEAANDESFEDYLNGLKENYKKNENIGLLFDAEKAGMPTMKYQKKQAGWMKSNDELIKKYCVGIAYVVPQTVLRTALKMIFKFYNNPVPFKVFENMTDGEKWVNNKLMDAGLNSKNEK